MILARGHVWSPHSLCLLAQRLVLIPRDALIVLLELSTVQILNVQVPFYFKSIIDSLNIDFVAIGGTAWTVGGAMIIACTQTPCISRESAHPLRRWYYKSCSCYCPRIS